MSHKSLPPQGPRTRFRVDGQDFEDAEAVNRYLVAGHTKAQLIDLLMVFIEESVEREAASPALDAHRLSQAYQAVVARRGRGSAIPPHVWQETVAQYARLTAAVPEEQSE